MKERWRWVINHRGKYRVSNFGKVKSVARRVKVGYGKTRRVFPRILKQSKGESYLYVGLRNNGKVPCHYIHKLVLEAFVGPCPPGMECRHKDGNALNNRLDNLSWGTRKQNAEDKRRHGTIPIGENHPNCKVSEEIVRYIRKNYKPRSRDGFSQVSLSKRFNLHQVTVSEIILRKIWRHIT